MLDVGFFPTSRTNVLTAHVAAEHGRRPGDGRALEEAMVRARKAKTVIRWSQVINVYFRT